MLPNISPKVHRRFPEYLVTNVRMDVHRRPCRLSIKSADSYAGGMLLFGLLEINTSSKAAANISKDSNIFRISSKDDFGLNSVRLCTFLSLFTNYRFIFALELRLCGFILKQDNHDQTYAVAVAADIVASVVDIAAAGDKSREPRIVAGRTKPPPADSHSVDGVIAVLISALCHSILRRRTYPYTERRIIKILVQPRAQHARLPSDVYPVFVVGLAVQRVDRSSSCSNVPKVMTSPTSNFASAMAIPAVRVSVSAR